VGTAMPVQRTPDLSSRQEEILAHVVEGYVATGTPVGSKTLVQRAAIDLSSSTVRYELAVLEEHGFLTHPHTSAGRVPTDAGYRYYVDQVLDRLEPRPRGFELDLSEARNQVDEALRATTDALAQVTRLVALVSAPPLETTIVRHVEVIRLQPQLVMVVVITSTGGVTKRVFAFTEPVDPGLAEWAREYLNERVAGLQLGARLLRARFEDPELAPGERAFLGEIAPAFTELVEAGEGSLYVGGTAGLLDELREEDLRGYGRLLEILEERAAMLELMRANLVSKEPFVRVGSEIGDPGLASISLVAAPYGLHHRNLGTVSLLGPTRMDYVKAIGAVRAAAHELSLFVEDLYEE
jgi:heat-inducible transcriptional repressor